MEEMLTSKEAARELGISDRAVRDAIQRGTLSATRKSPRVLLIHRSDLERYRRERLGVNGLVRWWREKKQTASVDVDDKTAHQAVSPEQQDATGKAAE